MVTIAMARSIVDQPTHTGLAAIRSYHVWESSHLYPWSSCHKEQTFLAPPANIAHTRSKANCRAQNLPVGSCEHERWVTPAPSLSPDGCPPNKSCSLPLFWIGGCLPHPKQCHLYSALPVVSPGKTLHPTATHQPRGARGMKPGCSHMPVGHDCLFIAIHCPELSLGLQDIHFPWIATRMHCKGFDGGKFVKLAGEASVKLLFNSVYPVAAALWEGMHKHFNTM